MTEAGAPHAPRATDGDTRPTAIVTTDYVSELVGRQFPNRPTSVLTERFVAPIYFSGLTGKKLLLFLMPGPSDPEAPMDAEAMKGWKQIDGACGCTFASEQISSSCRELPEGVQAVIVSTAKTSVLARVRAKLKSQNLWFASEPNATIARSLPSPRPQFDFLGTAHFGRFALLLEEGMIVAAWGSDVSVAEVVRQVSERQS